MLIIATTKPQKCIRIGAMGREASIAQAVAFARSRKPHAVQISKRQVRG